LSLRQRQAVVVLPSDPTDEELTRNWTLSERDRKETLRSRGEAPRRRFAVQLCTLVTYGRFLRLQDEVPLRILNHLGDQLGLAPLVIPDPPPRDDTEHLQRIREHLGFRAFDP